jgi:hypothetical protein
MELLDKYIDIVIHVFIDFYDRFLFYFRIWFLFQLL